jgi:AraC-like DNA-binding protein
MALRGTLKIRGGSARRWISCHAALINSDSDHEVDASNARVLIGFVDPESALGAALSARIVGDISTVPEREVARWRAALRRGAESDALRVERWVRTSLLSEQQEVKLHPGVNRVLQYLRANLGIGDDFALPKLARVAGLSQSRFMHVFTDSTGIALRHYILWLRLQRACGTLMSGASITEAAHRAGFSDAAHMTRTFRRMLGTTPKEMSSRREAARGISLEAN